MTISWLLMVLKWLSLEQRYSLRRHLVDICCPAAFTVTHFLLPPFSTSPIPPSAPLPQTMMWTWSSWWMTWTPPWRVCTPRRRTRRCSWTTATCTLHTSTSTSTTITTCTLPTRDTARPTVVTLRPCPLPPPPGRGCGTLSPCTSRPSGRHT